MAQLIKDATNKLYSPFLAYENKLFKACFINFFVNFTLQIKHLFITINWDTFEISDVLPFGTSSVVTKGGDTMTKREKAQFIIILLLLIIIILLLLK